MAYAIVALVYILFLAHVRSDTFVTKHGDIIPSQTLRTVLEYSLSPALARRVFHLSDEHVLIGLDRNYNISTLAPVSAECPLSNARHIYEKIDLPHSHMICKLGSALTFVYERESMQLLTAFGDDLELHPLHTKDYPGVFINRPHEVSLDDATMPKFTTNASTETSSETPAKRPETLDTRLRFPFGGDGACAKGVVRYIELAIAYDTTFCRAFRFDERKRVDFVIKVVRAASGIFARKTCIRLRIVHDDPNCKRETDAKESGFPAGPILTKPLNLASCLSEECKRASVVLNYYRNVFVRSYLLFRLKQDAVLVFTGYNDGTNVAGATFLKSICDPAFGFAWIEAPPSATRTKRGEDIMVAAIVHELGHLLGAPHDDKGIMGATIRRGQLRELSDASATAIIKFVDEDPLSWCVSREIKSDEQLINNNGWDLQPPPIPLASGIAFGRSPSENAASVSPVRDLYVLGPVDGTSVLGGRYAYSVWQDFTCGADRKCTAKSVLDSRGGKSTQFATPRAINRNRPISFSMASIQSPDSNDLLLAELDNVDKTVRYAIGYEDQSNTYNRAKWSTVRFIRDIPSKQVTSHSITFGSISGTQSKDFLWMHMSEGFGRRVVQYRVALSLDKVGRVKKGWSDDIAVPGWFGTSAGGLSATIFDVTGDGIPDLIFAYHETEEPTNSPYYRIGRNLDSTGVVKGGWSDVLRIPIKGVSASDGQDFNVRGIAIADLGRAQPVMVVRLSYRMVISDNAFGNLEFHSPDLSGAAANVASGCNRCLRGTNQADACQTDLKLCAAVIEEFGVRQGDLADTTNRKMSTMTRMPDPMGKEEEELFCIGFRYMYARLSGGDNCDITDRGVVIFNGMVEGLLTELRASNPGLYTEESRVVNNERPSGTNGPRRRPQIGSITLRSARKARTSLLRKAIKKFRRVYGSFLSSIRFRIKRIGTNTYLVTPFFTRFGAEI